MTKRIMVGNFKGGTGKTTTASLLSRCLAARGFRVLLVDMDPQGNATNLMLKTMTNIKKEEFIYKTTLMAAVAEGDLSQIVTKIDENLYILPSFPDFTTFPLFLERKFPETTQLNKRVEYFGNLLRKIDTEYDFVIIDTPPTVSLYTDSAVNYCDGVIVVMQTHEHSLHGARTFIEYLTELRKNNLANNLKVYGIIPVLMSNTSSVDSSILARAVDTFGYNNMFVNIVSNMERIKRWTVDGMPDISIKVSRHDKKPFSVYDNITNELLNKLDYPQSGSYKRTNIFNDEVKKDKKK